MKINGFAGMVMVLVLALSVSVQANLLVNGGFEDPATPLGSWNNTTPIPNWTFGGTYIPSGGWQAGLVGTDTGRVIDTKGARIWGNDTTLYQDFAATAGVDYAYNVYCHNNAAGDTTDGVLTMVASFYDASNTEILSQVIGTFDPATQLTQALGEWVQIGGSIAAPAGTVTGRVTLDLDGRTVGGMDFDNVSVVPEPATLALLAIGGMFLKRRRA